MRYKYSQNLTEASEMTFAENEYQGIEQNGTMKRIPTTKVKQGVHNATHDHVDFATNPVADTNTVGRLLWDDDAKTLSIVRDNTGGTKVSVEIGDEIQVRVKNTTGATILNGQPVYTTSALGNTPLIALADGDDPTKNRVTGLMTADITNNGVSYLTTVGLVHQVPMANIIDPADTSWTVGMYLYLSTVTGKLTKNRPSVDTAVRVGIITDISGSNCTILVYLRDDYAKIFDDIDNAITAIKGVGYTEGSLKTHEDRLDTLEGVVDTNRLYSDSQYLELKAKYDAQQIALNASKAELYTDAPILQYGSTGIIGKGYEADNTPIDVSANVVDGKLSMEQKGLTITNLVKNGDFSGGTTGWLDTQGGGVVIENERLKIFNTASEAKKQSYNFIVGDTYFIAFDVDIQRYVSGKIGVSLRNIAIETHTVTANTSLGTKRVIGIVTVTSPSNGFWLGNTEAANADVYYDNIAIYHLNALGLSTITDTAILAKLLPYVDGTKNVGKMGVRVVNKNLIKSVKQIYEGADFYLYTYLDGRFCARFTSGAIIEKTPITFLPSQQYTVTFEYQTRIRVAGGGGEAAFTFFYTDGTKSVASVAGNVNTTNWIKRTLTSTAGKTVRSVGVNAVDYRTYVYVSEDSFQLELGATSTTVEPYQEQLTFLPAIGNSLPNGVADSIKTVADGWEHNKRVSTPVSVASGVAVNTTNYPTAKNGGQWVNELTAGGTEIGVIGTDSTTGAGMLRFELATPIVTKYDLPHLTSGKTIHRFAGEEKIALYGTGLTFSENVLTVLSAIKFVAGVMTDITSLATITGDTVTFSGVDDTDVVYAQVEHDVDRPLGVLEHTPAVSNTASRLAAIEAWIAAQGA